MSKGLDCLHEYMRFGACINCQYHYGSKCNNEYECCWKTIEKELKEYEKLQTIVDNQKGYIDYLEEKNFQLCRDCQKQRKTLEIIKREPNTVIETITTYDTWEEYIKDYPLSDKTIWHIIENKSEFDLLKEVLL